MLLGASFVTAIPVTIVIVISKANRMIFFQVLVNYGPFFLSLRSELTST